MGGAAPPDLNPKGAFRAGSYNDAETELLAGIVRAQINELVNSSEAEVVH
jgi:hypothetical protein